MGENRAVAAREILPSLNAVADHWRRGDKALAGLRLVFSPLPKVFDQTASLRIGLAAKLLDDGFQPNDLLAEIGLEPRVVKYDRDEPRVPAGYSTGGQWTADPAFVPPHLRHPGAYDVAMMPEEDEKTYETRHTEGITTFQEDIEHGHPLDHVIPKAGALFPALKDAAKRAVDVVGPGSGAVYGSKLHAEFRRQVDALQLPGVFTEESYLNGLWSKYGKPGSIRVDVVGPSLEKPLFVFDLKTGSARLTDLRKQQLRAHLPQPDNEQSIDFFEVRHEAPTTKAHFQGASADTTRLRRPQKLASEGAHRWVIVRYRL